MPELRLHADNRCSAVRSIEAQAQRRGDRLHATFVFQASLQELHLPPPRTPRFVDGLWRHTCCELFVARHGSPVYHELNFSPSGEWALYSFSDYRDGGPLDQPVPLIRTSRAEGTFVLEAQVQWPEGPVLLGLSAVVEERNGALSYWALRHAPGKPDFHHRKAFALELA